MSHCLVRCALVGWFYVFGPGDVARAEIVGGFEVGMGVLIFCVESCGYEFCYDMEEFVAEVS